jgi:hypothetical protein
MRMPFARKPKQPKPAKPVELPPANWPHESPAPGQPIRPSPMIGVKR